MKRMMKVFSLLLAVMTLVSLTAAAEDAKVYKIGISQFAVHGSLDNCRRGFLEGLAEEGISAEAGNLEIDFQNANADTGAAAQIADKFVSENVDLICAIATPSAATCFNAAQDRSIPVIYTAVSDPVASQLANADGTNPGQITGTSDALPVEAQLKLIRAMQPDAVRIGILHTTSETNSDSTLQTYRELAPAYGFEIIDAGITSTADLAQALDVLLPQVDCTTNLTDNTVVQNLPLVLEASAEAGKPCYGSEIEQVRSGCAASEGIEYVELGRQTGRMAAKVLKGEAAAQDIPFEIIGSSFLYVNEEALAQFGLTLPAELAGRAIAVAAE